MPNTASLQKTENRKLKTELPAASCCRLVEMAGPHPIARQSPKIIQKLHSLCIFFPLKQWPVHLYRPDALIIILTQTADYGQ